MATYREQSVEIAVESKGVFKNDPVGRIPGRWTARAVQVRDEDGRKGAFPPPGREMRKKKIPISLSPAGRKRLEDIVCPPGAEKRMKSGAACPTG